MRWLCSELCGVQSWVSHIAVPLDTQLTVFLGDEDEEQCLTQVKLPGSGNTAPSTGESLLVPLKESTLPVPKATQEEVVAEHHVPNLSPPPFPQGNLLWGQGPIF